MAVEKLKDDSIQMVEIDKDWYVEDIETLEEAEDAVIFLENALIKMKILTDHIEAEIEGQIEPENARSHPNYNPHAHLLKVKAARRYKELALKQVNMLIIRMRKTESDRKKAEALEMQNLHQNTIEKQLLAFIKEDIGAAKFREYVVAAGILDVSIDTEKMTT